MVMSPTRRNETEAEKEEKETSNIHHAHTQCILQLSRESDGGLRHLLT